MMAAAMAMEEQLVSLDSSLVHLSSVEEYMCILQTCRKNKDINYANRLHVHICSHGLEDHAALGNHIVPLFVECGGISQAHQVFHRIDHRNEHAWTSLMMGLVESEEFEDAFHLFEGMGGDSVQPSGHTFLPLLKACAKLGSSERSHFVHTEIMKGGFDADEFVANALVDMYAKCSLLSEARMVFERLAARDVVSWNVLMAVYADCGCYAEVLELFEQMQQQNIPLSSVTFVCLLQSLGSTGAVTKGQELHAEIAREGLNTNLFVGSALVGMYSKCGLLVDARDVFNDLLDHDVIAWTALISGYAGNGLGEEACECLEGMQMAGVAPNTVTLVTCLKACHFDGLVDKGRAIHAELVKRGLEEDGGVDLVGFYAECGLLLEARQAFDTLPNQDVVACTALISGYVEHGQAEEALVSLEQMESVTLNSVLLACIIKASGRIGALDTGQVHHCNIVKEGLDDNSVLATHLMEMYIDCNSIEEAQDVFDDLPDHDIVAWSVLITGYIETGRAEEAFSCLTQMHLESLSPDAVIFVGILRACGSTKALEKGREFHSHITVMGFKEDFYVGNNLIDMYAKCGSVYEARQVLDCMATRHDVVSWSALVSGYVQNGLNLEVLDCISEMQGKGALPNDATYVSGLKACGKLGTIDEGLIMHVDIVKRGFDRHPLVGNSLVDFYIKGSLFEAGRELFDQLTSQDVVSWNTLMTGYADSGQGEAAMACLEEMRSQGVAPSAITYVAAFRSCSMLGDAGKGLELHNEIMEQELDAHPLVSSSLVDMYVKCEALAEARCVHDEMPIPGMVSCTALMSGYADNGYGEEVLELLEHLPTDTEPLDAVMFACILKACGALGDVERVHDSHAKIVKKGYDLDSFVSSTLVDSYAKCGSLIDAQDVFDEKADQDAISWSALIMGYVEHGITEEAFKCLDQVHLEEHMTPDAILLVCISKASGNLGTVEKGLEAHVCIARGGFEKDPLVLTTLVNMYSKCGMFIEAEEVFGELMVRDVVSWNALIIGHVEHGLQEKVLELFEQMQLEGVPPNVFTFLFCLKACTGMGSLEKGQQLHLDIAKLGFEGEPLLASSLIDMYGTCRFLREAEQVHQRLPVHDQASWNALLTAYAEQGLYVEILGCLEEMQWEGVFPDATSFVRALKGCSSTDRVDLVDTLHTRVVEEGFEKEPLVVKALLVVYARHGFLIEAQHLFDEVPVKDSYLWSVMALAYADQGANGRLLSLYAGMLEQGTLPNGVTFLSILGACGSLLALDEGRRIHAQVCGVAEVQAAPLILSCALIDMYGKCGSMLNAEKVFNAMPKEDVTGWNALITGYARHGESNLVFRTFERLKAEGVSPNDITFLVVMTACSHVGLVEEGQAYFEAMSREHGIIPAIKHQSCMLDIYGRTGQLDEVVGLLDDMPTEQDYVLWNTVLSACHKWGNVELGEGAFGNAASIDRNKGGSFVLMSNIVADAHV